ncbi:hypothetical protein CNMCM8980_003560 [Aspergillus fumigatiaffinis]|uniref:Uncharacterized protein n=1 Tax=Aspergillus fumigatiaffinis TaxID=340414 RepID=A0A8H4M6S9_9EURO|nr:hypothetical protein CNMCM6457_003600 [Aspergillus fumigatiaffinis]KAF4220742.1 hypothetical protein CNMCM5878_000398 [Aspergillus fumigatiaffinis]KAF4232284.1 hypothetical protein CNMCM6805_010022 [Aspergillus fumigatiaffinis]KAF4235407.1 hypothetical protein CNMCM8980_003560 [Aspergillus fumigatiaffinis]
MRLSYRVGLATLLILAFILIKRHLDSLQDGSHVPSSWQFSNVVGGGAAEPVATPTSKPENEKPQETPVPAVEEPLPIKQTYEITPIIVPNDRVIVMAKLSKEDTSWVSTDLNEWRNFIYTVDDVNAARHTPKNKGRESLAYLQYIVDHYHDLPSTMVFLHSHKDGWQAGWHTDTLDYSNVESVRSLQTEFVQQSGFVNLRCQSNPGCPQEIRPLEDPPQPGKENSRVYARVWEELHNNTNIPEIVGAPCCSQFAVSKAQVLKRPLSDYQRYYNWVLTNKLPDELTAWIMEYSWHIIFGKDPVFCPDTYQCYQDVYGNPYFW